MQHEAKVDARIGGGIICGIVMPAIGSYTTSSPWGLATSIFVALLILGFLYPQWYETTADALVIRAGLTTRRIPYSMITAVRPSSSRRSSFALSLDRVEIVYGAKSLLIAPKNQEAFFADVATRAPQLYAQAQNISFASID